MKYKHYTVEYSVITHHEAILLARSRTEAKEKVIEIIGEPVTIESICELKSSGKNEHTKLR